MNIANIIEEGKVGGPQIRMVMVAALSKNYMDTTIIMPQDNSLNFQKLCKDNNVNYKVMAISRITKEVIPALKYIFFSIFEIIRLAIYLNKKKFDLVHVSGGSWQYKGVIAGKLARVKVVWHLNDTYSPIFIRNIFSKVNILSDGFIFSAKCSKEYYERYIDRNIPLSVIPAPVDTDKFHPKLQYVGDEDIINKLENKFVVGMVANINPIKGIDDFIKIASKINSTIPNCQFVIVGDIYKNQRRYYEKIKALCSDLSVNNVNFVSGRKEVRPLLNRFDVYLCSSKAESSPISVWEAMSMGKPIVAFNVGDIGLYVTNNINGYIEEVGACNKIAKNIIRLWDDNVLRDNFGYQSRLIAKRELDLSLSLKKYISIYKAILQ